MRTIAILFSLDGQKFSKIKKQLEKLKHHYDSVKEDGEPVEVQMVNGHLPREIAEEINSTEVRDVLDKLFPNQINFFDEESGKISLEEMAEYVADMGGRAYFIGKGLDAEYKVFKSWIDEDNITKISI